MRYWIILLWTYSVVAFAGAVWATVRFLQASEPKEMALWAGLWLILVLAIMLAKIWYWMEVNKNVVVCELKRVELQIAFLAKSVAKK